MPELELVQIVGQVLSANAVERAHDDPLDEAEHALNRVRVNVRSQSHILASAVSNRFMPAVECLSNWLVEIEVVGDESARQVCVLCDEVANPVLAVNRCIIRNRTLPLRCTTPITGVFSCHVPAST